MKYCILILLIHISNNSNIIFLSRMFFMNCMFLRIYYSWVCNLNSRWPTDFFNPFISPTKAWEIFDRFSLKYVSRLITKFWFFYQQKNRQECAFQRVRNIVFVTVLCIFTKKFIWPDLKNSNILITLAWRLVNVSVLIFKYIKKKKKLRTFATYLAYIYLYYLLNKCYLRKYKVRFKTFKL